MSICTTRGAHRRPAGQCSWTEPNTWTNWARSAAQEFEEVRECACIGVEDPDGLLGWVPVLYVAPEGPGFDRDQLIRFLSQKLERYKLPQRMILLQQLPRNRMQKIDRKALKELWKESGDQELMNETVRTILSRRSVRDFTDKPVPRVLLDVILQAGIYAPSGYNMQTWRFTVMQGQDQIQELKEAMGRVAREKQVYFYGFNNPVVVVLVSNDRRNADGIQDSSCAAQNIMLAQQDAVRKEELLDAPLIFSRQAMAHSLKGNELTNWFGVEPEKLNISTTFNLFYNAAIMVDAGLGYAVTLDKLANTSESSNLTFRPLEPRLESDLVIVWKKYPVFSVAA